MDADFEGRIFVPGVRQRDLLPTGIVKGRRFDVAREDYEPVVTIVVPLYNEGHSIYDTIVSLISLDYPPEEAKNPGRWSTLSMLPLLAESLSSVPHRFTLMFVAFTGC